VAKTVYITRAPPVVERPLCKGCQKPLKPAYRSKNIELSQDITGMLKDPEAFPAEGCRYVGLGHCSDAPLESIDGHPVVVIIRRAGVVRAFTATVRVEKTFSGYDSLCGVFHGRECAANWAVACHDDPRPANTLVTMKECDS